ncbi:MAG: hypothetical protein ACR2PK_05635 [Acidimicrobiales bacterium]
MAFVDPVTSKSEALGRAYLLTGEQFQDVLAQESGREVGTEIEISVAFGQDQVVVGSGKYDRLLGLGTLRDLPMATFTTPLHAGSMDRNAPSPAYADTITSGLMESHGLTRRESDDYLSDWDAADHR